MIGLEVHVQLATKSKIFSWSSAAFGAEPNTHDRSRVPRHAGHAAGAQPRGGRVGGAPGAGGRLHDPPRCRFARKHYFYPDLPKGYQISQFDEPICEGGAITFRLRGEARSVRLTRIHMEEDAGKNLHAAAGVSFVDYNRAGVPLCEIVSEPDVRSAEEAAEYVRAIRALVRYLGICDGNMEEGSLRCDANVSLRLRGATELGTKAELKNMNSFKNVRDAIEHEVKRQATLLDRGERVVQETRLWDAGARRDARRCARRSRRTTTATSPSPTCRRCVVDEAWLERVRATLPELPEDRFARYTTAEGLSPQDAGVLVAEREIADYFDAAVAAGGAAQARRQLGHQRGARARRRPAPARRRHAARPRGGAGRAGRAHRGRHAVGQAGQGRLRAHVDRAPARRRDRRRRGAGAGLGPAARSRRRAARSSPPTPTRRRASAPATPSSWASSWAPS